MIAGVTVSGSLDRPRWVVRGQPHSVRPSAPAGVAGLTPRWSSCAGGWETPGLRSVGAASADRVSRPGILRERISANAEPGRVCRLPDHVGSRPRTDPASGSVEWRFPDHSGLDNHMAWPTPLVGGPVHLDHRPGRLAPEAMGLVGEMCSVAAARKTRLQPGEAPGDVIFASPTALSSQRRLVRVAGDEVEDKVAGMPGWSVSVLMHHVGAYPGAQVAGPASWKPSSLGPWRRVGLWQGSCMAKDG